MDFATHLERCRFKPNGGPDSPDLVSQLEERVGVQLPSEYREFLLSIGGGYIDAWSGCTFPTPFGDHGMTTLHDTQEVIGLLESTVVPRNMICIGYGDFGATTCLSIAGLDHGHVFSLDTEMRFYWDEDDLNRYPHLDPKIREFFRLRDAEELPARPWGYDHCYHVADSFMDYLRKIRPSEDLPG